MIEIDPKSKLVIDAVIDADDRRRDRRAWSFWLTVLVLSLAAGWGYRIEALPGFVRIGLAAFGAVGALLFLAFLSTKPFGRDFYNGPDWWWSW